MRLTVGPLPAVVYWRRRAVVFGVLLVAVLLLWSACSGSSDASRNAGDTPGSTAPTTAVTTASSDVLVPSVGGTPTTSQLPVPPPTLPTTTAAPPAAGTPECPDAQLLVSPAPASAAVPRGAFLDISLKVKNIGPQPCVRDLGADAQELYLQAGTTKVWSSDECDGGKAGTKPTTIEASIEHSFTVAWDGKATNAGCQNRDYPPIGKYQLFARVGTKISDPVTIQLT